MGTIEEAQYYLSLLWSGSETVANSGKHTRGLRKNILLFTRKTGIKEPDDAGIG